jgi:type III secretion protein R
MLGTDLPNVLQFLLFVLLLGMLPFFAVMVTSYTKIVIVLHLLRNALGVQSVPPNVVLNGMALVLSAYIMAPVIDEVTTRVADSPVFKAKRFTFEEISTTMKSAGEPVKKFLVKHSGERERRFFLLTTRKIWPERMHASVKETDLLIVLPAFTIAELTAAFQIGFLVYLAFIVVDMIIASVLLAAGMAMVSPTIIAVPFKLLLFVVLDGWSALVYALVLSYQ